MWQSEDFEILYYRKSAEFLVPHVGGSIRNSLQFYEALYGWTPSEKPIKALSPRTTRTSIRRCQGFGEGLTRSPSTMWTRRLRAARLRCVSG